MVEVVLSRTTDTLPYLLRVSQGIFNRAVDILVDSPQERETPAGKRIDPSWVAYGRLALDGFRFTHKLERDGVDPLRFLRATTTPEEELGVILNPIFRAKPQETPTLTEPGKFHRIGRALEVFHHSLTTLGVLNSKREVCLSDFYPIGFADEHKDVFVAPTFWQREYIGEGVWSVLSEIDASIRRILLYPAMIVTRTDYQRVRNTACFFAAGRQLLTQPANRESEREMVKRMLAERGKS